jgi:hypothetical protein
VRQLLQLIGESRGLRRPLNLVWEKNGRYFDALRPSVEPSGFSAPDLVGRHRAQHLERVLALFNLTSLFIFTMGLTETWENIEDGTVYPTAPGAIAGDFSQGCYRFKNLTYEENLADFVECRELLKELNPEMKFIITVSPVPLAATASGHHVLSATTYSKSVLRAVAGALSQRFDDVDYFPSYEIISGIQARGFFYEPDLRNVSSAGVDCVMDSFFAEHQRHKEAEGPPEGEDAAAHGSIPPRFELPEQQAFCEEILLDAFAP